MGSALWREEWRCSGSSETFKPTDTSVVYLRNRDTGHREQTEWWEQTEEGSVTKEKRTHAKGEGCPYQKVTEQ